MKKLKEYDNIVVLTGGGISQESGLRTLRDERGEWIDKDAERLFTAEALKLTPAECLSFHKKSLESVLAHGPNEAHKLLVAMEEACRNFTLVTLNTDGYHQIAGSSRVWELHGSIRRSRCIDDSCNYSCDSSNGSTRCPRCSSLLRPDIVLYGEMLNGLSVLKVRQRIRECDLFMAVGASGQVYPASSFVEEAHEFGADTLNINVSASDNICFSDQIIKGATEGLKEVMVF